MQKIIIEVDELASDEFSDDVFSDLERYARSERLEDELGADWDGEVPE